MGVREEVCEKVREGENKYNVLSVMRRADTKRVREIREATDLAAQISALNKEREDKTKWCERFLSKKEKNLKKRHEVLVLRECFEDYKNAMDRWHQDQLDEQINKHALSLAPGTWLARQKRRLEAEALREAINEERRVERERVEREKARVERERVERVARRKARPFVNGVMARFANGMALGL